MSAPKDPKGMFWCDHCKQYLSEAEMMGDNEPICQSCYENAIDQAHDEMKEVA